MSTDVFREWLSQCSVLALCLEYLWCVGTRVVLTEYVRKKCSLLESDLFKFSCYFYFD